MANRTGKRCRVVGAPRDANFSGSRSRESAVGINENFTFTLSLGSVRGVVSHVAMTLLSEASRLQALPSPPVAAIYLISQSNMFIGPNEPPRDITQAMAPGIDRSKFFPFYRERKRDVAVGAHPADT